MFGKEGLTVRNVGMMEIIKNVTGTTYTILMGKRFGRPRKFKGHC